MVLKMADLLEENRTYPDAEPLRKAMTDDLEESMLLLLRAEQKMLLERGKPYDTITDEAVSWLEELHEKKTRTIHERTI